MLESINGQTIEKPATANHEVKGYFSFIIPWVTFSKDGTTAEFQKFTTIGFPIGLNVYYSKKFGVSYEITPLVQWYHPTGGTAFSRTNNLLFDPGIIFRGKNGFNFVPRLAFETQGRYGFTPVFNKVYLKTKDVDYWFSVSIPTRFGNNVPVSVGGNLQIGFTLN
ncbi:MAG: hypothetical protein EKK39_11385 [Sphingobacteriales bacterium]|uniref:hypothetical protein n=1 Tax=Hydrotalea flava TaxID=714549 RepID=UPI000FAE63D5|nr:hypothetical protein [Hydrotalea flava]RTL49335.1 MAG: hypothetical protein EKK39_11385 [Sphingobacteriales bacterium]